MQPSTGQRHSTNQQEAGPSVSQVTTKVRRDEITVAGAGGPCLRSRLLPGDIAPDEKPIALKHSQPQ